MHWPCPFSSTWAHQGPALLAGPVHWAVADFLTGGSHGPFIPLVASRFSRKKWRGVNFRLKAEAANV